MIDVFGLFDRWTAVKVDIIAGACRAFRNYHYLKWAMQRVKAGVARKQPSQFIELDDAELFCLISCKKLRV